MIWRALCFAAAAKTLQSARNAGHCSQHAESGASMKSGSHGEQRFPSRGGCEAAAHDLGVYIICRNDTIRQ